MSNFRRSSIISAAVVAAFVLPAAAQVAAPADPGFAVLEAQESAANAKPGPRTVPGRSIPVPGTVSPQSQTAIALPSLRNSPVPLSSSYKPKRKMDF